MVDDLAKENIRAYPLFSGQDGRLQNDILSSGSVFVSTKYVNLPQRCSLIFILCIFEFTHFILQYCRDQLDISPPKSCYRPWQGSAPASVEYARWFNSSCPSYGNG
jgi:hypothetical protein